jgi:uncharacterized lipoprotein
MHPRTIGRLLALAAMALLPACALTEDVIEVRHVPAFGVQQLPGANAVTVQVSPRDERNTNRHRVSAKKNGYGMEMASIVASNDVVAEVGGIVASTLRNLGFRTEGQPDGTVTVELHKLWNDFKAGFFSGQAVTELATTVTVRDRMGRITYSRLHNVEGIHPNIHLASGENARVAILRAFELLAQRLQSDGEFAQALLDLRRADPPATAPEMPRTRSGRPVS